MKPPLSQIANQVSKVELRWPAILPLPRLSPLMSKVASMAPNLPLPNMAAKAMRPNATPPLPPPFHTDVTLPANLRPLPALPSMTASVPEPIFESAVETIGAPTDFTRIVKLDFE